MGLSPWDHQQLQLDATSRSMGRLGRTMGLPGLIVLMLIGASIGSAKLNPRTAPEYISRANYYALKQKDQLALTNYNKAISLAPKLAEAYERRGDFYLKESYYLNSYNKKDERDKKVVSYLGLDLSKAPEMKRLAFTDYQKAITIHQHNGQQQRVLQIKKVIQQNQQGKKATVHPFLPFTIR